MKNMKKIALALVLVMALVALTACGSKSIEGTWQVTKMSANVDGVKMDIDVSDYDEELIFTFKNGTVTFNGDEAEYTVSGDKLVINGEECTYKLNGSTLTLTMNYGGESMTFTMKKK